MFATGLFKRLKLRHAYAAPQFREAAYSFGEVRGGTFQGICYDTASVEPLETIPLEHRHHFQCMLMTVVADWVPPHVDNGIKTAINFYIETADAITTFYRAKPRYRRRRLPNQTSGCIIHADDVLPVASFTAASGDVFVLNVREIHSVRSGQQKPRVAYQLQTVLSFDCVLDMLEASDAADC